MKLKALGAMCKRAGSFCLYDRVNEDGEVVEQWLGTGAAVFQLSGLPYLTEEHLIALFDITEKQRENTYFSHKPLPASLNFADADGDETMLDREKLTMGYNGRIVRPILTRGGLEFMDNDYLTPLADVADDLELYERHTEGGGVYFAAKMGLMLVGVIMPLNIIEEKFVDHLDTLAEKCRAALEQKREREAEDERRRQAEKTEQAELGGGAAHGKDSGSA